MKPGTYHVVWFDTRKGKATDPETVSVAPGAAIEIRTPAIAQDMAAWVSP
jgi:hypothetical protein